MAAFPEAERDLLRDRLGRNEQAFAQRVQDSLALAGPWFADMLTDPVRWAKLVKDARNEVAHGKQSSLDPGGMVALAAGVGHLVGLCLLRAAGAPEVLTECFARSCRHSEISAWTSRYLPDC